MDTESASVPQTPPVTGSTSASSAYYERESQLQIDRFKDSAKKVIPVMVRIGELLEAAFLATPDSPLQKYVDFSMKFICSCVNDFENYQRDVTLEEQVAWFLDFIANPAFGSKSWRELLNHFLTFYVDLPLGMSVIQIQDYAYNGLGPSDDHGVFDNTVKREEYVRRLLQVTKPTVTALGVDNPAARDLSAVLLAAEARLELDEGRDVTPEQLAALRRIEIKSMRNALAPSSGSGLKMRDGEITAESALKWLHAWGKYKLTLWPEEEQRPADEPIAGEVLFVPFASDDIEFHPVTCRRDDKYTVGPKGAEQTFADYRAALDCLARMKPAAYWKHPNTANNWRTVTAAGFRPRTPLELGLEPAEGGEK